MMDNDEPSVGRLIHTKDNESLLEDMNKYVSELEQLSCWELVPKPRCQ